MQDSRTAVLIAAEQGNDEAQQNFEDLVSKVSAGEVKGVVLADQTPGSYGGVGASGAHFVRRGALWGACAGFLIGMVPLLASTIIAAGAGALIAKASELRFEAGTAPRLHLRKAR